MMYAIAEKDEEIYEFSELHVTGGNATVRITRSQIIAYMCSFNPWYRTVLSDKAVEEFCVVHWAHKVKGTEGRE